MLLQRDRQEQPMLQLPQAEHLEQAEYLEKVEHLEQAEQAEHKKKFAWNVCYKIGGEP